MKNEEHHIQKSCVQWFGLQYPKMADLLISSTNGSHLAGTKLQRQLKWKRLEAEGAKAGVPDLFLAHTVFARCVFIDRSEYAGLWIEMKTPTGRLQPSQKHYLKRLAGQGYAVAVCRSIQDFQKVIKDYLAGEHINDEKLTHGSVMFPKASKLTYCEDPNNYYNPTCQNQNQSK